MFDKPDWIPAYAGMTMGSMLTLMSHLVLPVINCTRN